ncbi:FliO/MopB family protein [Adhaeretor mobilis]|uniref:FliO/MopB family protein n=1 Tax=Adhaeretor mobilis TaxID=1930276 RepID=UPI001C54D286|nr:flagellar biosynthetic protein FliO [Adhaeretor mobilis]
MLLVLHLGTASLEAHAAKSLLSYRSDQTQQEAPAAVMPRASRPNASQTRAAQPITAQSDPFGNRSFPQAQQAQPQRIAHRNATAPQTVFRGNLPDESLAEAPRPRAIEAESRRLAPSQEVRVGDSGSKTSTKSALPFAVPVKQLISTAGAGLAIVIGLFFICTWLWRGGSNRPNPNSPLPQEAFSVLGRAPLMGRTTAQLIRVGNKLVLVAVSAEGLQPLTEVTDPAEVDRLAGLCLGGGAASSTAEFQKVLRKLASEPASGFLGRESS